MNTSLLGRLERLMLTYGVIEFCLKNPKLYQEFTLILEKEGFVYSNSDKTIHIEIVEWNDGPVAEDEDSLKIIYPNNLNFVRFLLSGDIVPPYKFEPVHVKLPKVSLITSVFNSEKYFKSFFKQLKSISYPRELIEIIIIDDGSDDKETVDKFVGAISNIFPKVRFHRNKENMGIFYSKMIGARVSESKYISFWDIDDLYDPIQIKLLAVHNELLEGTGLDNFLVSLPSVIIDKKNYQPITVWKTSYKEPISQLIKSMLTLHGTVSISSSLLHRDMVIKAYDVLEKTYRILDLVPKLSVPEDTILVNQMMIEGYIKKIYPISYTARGHIRGGGNTSADLKRRVREIPVSVAILIGWCCKVFGESKCMGIFESNIGIFYRSLSMYGDLSKEFLDNLIDYAKVIGGNCVKEVIKAVSQALANFKTM